MMDYSAAEQDGQRSQQENIRQRMAHLLELTEEAFNLDGLAKIGTKNARIRIVRDGIGLKFVAVTKNDFEAATKMKGFPGDFYIRYQFEIDGYGNLTTRPGYILFSDPNKRHVPSWMLAEEVNALSSTQVLTVLNSFKSETIQTLRSGAPPVAA